MDGILLINKPAGISSFGVVSRVRGIIKATTGQKIKIGHTGTLDPMATGLLILVLGKYTKRAAEFSKLDKVYEVEAILGKASTTADSEGEITEVSDKEPSFNDVEAALSKFVGDIKQMPPAFSAIKVNGQRAYKLAREGKEVVLEAREVSIFSIEEIIYEYPKTSFKAHVGSGTYIRSLVVDVGRELGTGAYMSALQRTKVGSFSLKDAIDTDSLDFEKIEASVAKQW